jgi:hypothetical protein
LNTHTKGAFYEAFDPETARAVLSRLEFHYTPKHGSWLNIAENERSSMTRPCLKDRRFGRIEELRNETIAWHSAINHRQRGVDWQFRIEDARVKLRTVYPKLVMWRSTSSSLLTTITRFGAMGCSPFSTSDWSPGTPRASLSQAAKFTRFFRNASAPMNARWSILVEAP